MLITSFRNYHHSYNLPIIKFVVSVSGDVNVDSSEEVPPLLLARWCVGVDVAGGGGVTVTCVFEDTCVELL